MSASEPLRLAFVCVGNAGRSQMAAAFAEREVDRRGLDGRVVVTSGGTQPADHVHPEVVEAMAEVDIEIGGRTPRAITPVAIEPVDLVITMGCSADGFCPADWAGEVRDWALDDPQWQDLEAVREIRDEIGTHVNALLDELEVEIRG